MNPKHQYSRRAFLKTLGAAAVAAPLASGCVTARSRANTLGHASFGTGGMAWQDLTQIAKCPGVEIVAVCDVDLDRTVEARKLFPQARVYQDWRKLLEKEARNLDSVNVSTPDHMHAAIAMTAMRMGKHVYGQKPLAHDLYEVRRMTEYAGKRNLVTQMGIQVHSSPHYRTAWCLVHQGVIGKIKEVHSWCWKSWGDTASRPNRTDPVPANLDWDLWLGVCADRPFIGDRYYHPDNWRKRLDFGTGSLGDMGCHIFDPVFMALDLGAPLSVRSEGPEPNPWNWAPNGKVHYRFPGTQRTASDILPFTWYDGDNLPPAEILALLEGEEVPKSGSIFVGTEGVMRLPHYGRATLYPNAKFEDFEYPQIEEHYCPVKNPGKSG